MTQILDPADRLDEAFVQALVRRYSADGPLYSGTTGERPLPVKIAEADERYANVCDVVVQLLWPEKYGTGVDDDARHTSDPARRIAALIFEAAGIDV
jgi:hypothetical protein